LYEWRGRRRHGGDIVKRKMLCLERVLRFEGEGKGLFVFGS